MLDFNNGALDTMLLPLAAVEVFSFFFFSHGGAEALWIYLLTYSVHRRACVFEDALHACLLFSEELLLGSDQI